MCFKCKNKRSEFNQKIYDDNHKKIDYAAFLAAGGVDDESTKQEQQEEVVDVREMDDDDGPPTLCVSRRPVSRCRGWFLFRCRAVSDRFCDIVACQRDRGDGVFTRHRDPTRVYVVVRTPSTRCRAGTSATSRSTSCF
jgi:hypothetical protein